MRFCPLSALVLPLAIAAAPALAQDTAPPPPVSIDASASVVSDYRFRGVSRSGLAPAVQGSVTIAHESGFYASVWASSVHGYVIADRSASAEIDLIGGWKKDMGGTTLDLGVTYYLFPHSRLASDQTASNYIEPYAAVSHTFGPLSGKLSARYAPRQRAMALDQGATLPLVRRDNLYLAGDLSADVPATPFSLSAHLGHSFGPSWLATDASGRRGYSDWNLGATWTRRIVTIGVKYVDTDARFLTPHGSNAARAGVLGSVSLSF